MRDYQKTADSLIKLAETKLVNDSGLFVEGRDAEGKLSKIVIVDDLGDFLPFIGYFGREDIVDRHLAFLEENKDTTTFNRAFAYSDFLFGLLWYGRYCKYSKRSYALFDFFFGEVLHKFLNGYPSSLKKFGIKIPLLSSLDATFIEVFTEAYRYNGDAELLKRAKDLVEIFSESKFFRKTGLLPEWLPVGFFKFLDGKIPFQKFNSVRLMKNNTSYGFALIDLYLITEDKKLREVFDRLVLGISSLAIVDGGVLPFIGKNSSKNPYLTPSFAVIDMLCDAYEVFREETYLELATKIAYYWIERQSPITGLFPNEADGNESYLDSETDMAISLIKLSEHTGVEDFWNSAYKTIDGILKYHVKKEGVVLQVNIDNGEVTDASQKTKFSLLLLKPFVYFAEKSKVYSNDKLLTLLKDR